MSNTQFVFILKDNVPKRESLQESIDKLGFDLTLDTDFDLMDEGFSPCILNGEEDIGFEIFCELASEVIEEEGFGDMAGDNDFCISLCWGGSMKDCAAVMIVSAALTKNFGATVSYEGEEPEEPEKLMSSASQAIKEADISFDTELLGFKLTNESCEIRR